MNRSDISRATYLIMAVFLLQPLALGGWLALIPQVKADLGLSKSQLAIALMGIPLAVVPGLQIAGRVISRFGPRRVSAVFFPLQALAFILPLLAWSGPSLFCVLFFAGLMMAFIEVGMNVYAGRLEKQTTALIMNRCHGFWAFGLMLGSATIAVTGQGMSPQIALAVISAMGGVLAARALVKLPGEETDVAPPRRAMSKLPPALLLIALFMFVITLVEGVMADWAAVYLSERLNDPTARAGLAVTIFSAFLAGGRFLGDVLKGKFGAMRHAQLTLVCVVLGLLGLILPLPLWVAYIAFAFVGFGVSAAYPLGVSAVAALDDRYEAPNIAIAATVAMGGFMIGPPLIGFLGQAFSLAIAFAALLPGVFLAFWLTRWLRPEDQSESH
ncbi:MAG: MFS transporter [Pseudomonadota bacterium]